MQLSNSYYYFIEAIPKHTCDAIVKYGLQLKDQMAQTGGFGLPIAGIYEGNKNIRLDKKQIKDLKKKRDSNIVWINHANWIYKELHPYVNEANEKSGWNFQWDYSESCQFTKYNKGQYYGWHCDGWDRPYDQPGNINHHGKIRKLSITLSLSEYGKDYRGGDLEFDMRNKDPDKKRNIQTCKQIRPKGSMVIFPSFLWHQVKPVTKGRRYSLVVWNIGWPFK
jgi:PKHD-type hydroxylase|tara:strand:+ start:859 stop:1524 length:666 start_codon:yes stop_codon:yes gene_type:complete